MGPEKGVISQEESLESPKSLNSLESLEEMVGFSFIFQSGGSRKSLDSLNTLEIELF